MAVPIPCGGCGATKNSERCIGCFHDFGTPDSAWVREYWPQDRAASLARQSEARAEEDGE